MNHKASLKQWLKTNEKYFQNHPEALRNMLNDPTFLARFNQQMASKKSRLERRLARLEQKGNRSLVSTKRKSRLSSLLRLPSISSMSQKLNQANELIETIRNLSNTIR